MMLRMPAKRITPRPEVERQGDGDDVLGERLDPVEVGQLSLDPEYSNDMLLCYCGIGLSLSSTVSFHMLLMIKSSDLLYSSVSV